MGLKLGLATEDINVSTLRGKKLTPAVAGCAYAKGLLRMRDLLGLPGQGTPTEGEGAILNE